MSWMTCKYPMDLNNIILFIGLKKFENFNYMGWDFSWQGDAKFSNYPGSELSLPESLLSSLQTLPEPSLVSPSISSASSSSGSS